MRTTADQQALEHEMAAIDAMGAERTEPDWSVLHISGASLALDCGRFDICRRLAADGLAGDPEPAEEFQLLMLRRRASRLERG